PFIKNRERIPLMSMSNPTAAISRAGRKLRELGSDAIQIPGPSELLQRKKDELSFLRQEESRLIAKQVAAEKARGAQHGPTADAPVRKAEAEKFALQAKIKRVEGETSILLEQVRALRPAPEPTEQQKVRQGFGYVTPSDSDATSVELEELRDR